jgi:hypothetical protein
MSSIGECGTARLQRTVGHEKLPPEIEHMPSTRGLRKRLNHTRSSHGGRESASASELPAWANWGESVKLIEVHSKIRCSYVRQVLCRMEKRYLFEPREFAVDLILQSALIC